MNKSVGFGIVGTGMIAGAIADALSNADHASLIAVSGRRIETAQKFVNPRNGVTPVEGFEKLIQTPNVDAIYVATPTSAKEEIALAAIAAKKHVLVDKPFTDHASVLRMTEAAKANGVLFMDATHFVHHPRTHEIRRIPKDKIGTPKSLHTVFYFPMQDRNNIRFDVKQEPTGALGDMGWYSMRAVVEYLRPSGLIKNSVTVVERDPSTNAVARAQGLIAFESGEVSTFDVGYTCGAVLMDLQLLGTKGVIGVDDFVLDWSNNWAFNNPQIKIGYTFKTGANARADLQFIETPARKAQEVLMVDKFAELVNNGADSSDFISASLKTQQYLDHLWKSV